MEKFPSSPESGNGKPLQRTETHKMSAAKKLLFEGIIALGLAGLVAGGQKAEAQNVSGGQKIETKDQGRDFLHVNDLIKNVAHWEFFKAIGAIDQKTADKMHDDLIKRYGYGALIFGMKMVAQTDRAGNFPDGDPRQKKLDNGVEFVKEAMENPDFERKISSLAITHDNDPSKDADYVVTRLQIDGKEVDTLITFAHVETPPHVAPDSEEKEVYSIAVAKQEALKSKLAAEPEGDKLSHSVNDFDMDDLLIKGDQQHPGWYAVKAVGSYEHKQ